jgi:hypothetical protein
MGLKDKWADERERSRQQREADATSPRLYAKSAELLQMGVFSHAPAGLPDKSFTEADLDEMIQAEKQRRSELYDAVMRAGTVTLFRALRVQVLTGGEVVYTIGAHDRFSKANTSRPLGPLAGAVAQVTERTPAFSWGKAALMPLATAPLARKETADALITFTSGKVHSVGLDGSLPVPSA